MTHTVGYCPGKKSACPRCMSNKVSIFFKPGFLGRKMNQWCELMDKHDFELNDSYETILQNNFAPNWICKNCYNGGVILKKLADSVITE